MTPRRTRKAAIVPTVLETAAEAHLALVQAAQRARESKDLAMAKTLTARAKALRADLARAQKSFHKEWEALAQKARTGLLQAEARLSRDLRRAEKAKPLAERALRIAAAAAKLIARTRSPL